MVVGVPEQRGRSRPDDLEIAREVEGPNDFIRKQVAELGVVPMIIVNDSVTRLEGLQDGGEEDATVLVEIMSKGAVQVLHDPSGSFLCGFFLLVPFLTSVQMHYVVPIRMVPRLKVLFEGKEPRTERDSFLLLCDPRGGFQDQGRREVLEDDVGESTEGWKEKWGEVGIRLTRSHADGDDCFDDDPEFFDQLPPLPPFLSDDDESFLGIEEGDPVLRFGDSDGPPEEREADLTDRFGDEEEVGSRRRRSGFR